MKPTTRRKIMDLCRWFANTKVDKKFASFQFDPYQPGKIYALEEPPNHKSMPLFLAKFHRGACFLLIGRYYMIREGL